MRYSALLMVLCALLPAAQSPAQKVGSTSMQFLHVMPVARATALGDAYSVWASGAEAVFWNPAGLALVQNQELSLTYIDWIFDTRQGALSYGVSLGEIGSVGAQVQYVDFGEFEETSTNPAYMVAPNWGLTGRTFRPFSMLVGLTYSRMITDRFSTGITIKYAHESLFSGDYVQAAVSQSAVDRVKTWAEGFLYDFGIRYNTGFHSVQLGASVQNFGAEMRYARESHPVPLLFRFGIAGDIIGRDALLADVENNRVSVAFELFQPNDYAQQEHVGLEYSYQETFALRGGYKMNYDNEGFTVGGGIAQTIGTVRLSLDYSYGSIGTYLGNVQRISLGAGLP